MDHTIPVVVAPSSAATTSSSVIQVFMPNMVTGDQIAVPPGRDLSYEAWREQQRDIAARGIVTQTRFTAQNAKCCISNGWRKPQILLMDGGEADPLLGAAGGSQLVSHQKPDIRQ